VRTAGLAIVALALALVASCGTRPSDAGGNFRLSQSQLEPTTTTLPPQTSTTAQARGAELEVFREKPSESPTSAAAPAVPAAFSAARVQPIPRPGLAFDFAQATPTGWRFKNPTYFGNPLVMVVTAVEGDWVEVLIPARPNGQQGWVRASDVDLAQHQFHAELVVSERLLTVWDNYTPVAQTNVVVGTEGTPTPQGTFYIAEKIPAEVAGVNPNGAYGPWILATNAYSETLDSFDGGLPVIAFHGTNSPQLIGSAVSNGCVRMPNDVVTLLADTIPAGTPVTIRE
jgi:lipoprotein-anchoring transpeptidase ErfK/SrfK